jgi:hypothetical protein
MPTRKQQLRLNAGWAAVAVTILISFGGFLYNMSNAVTYGNAIGEMQTEKLRLIRERQELIVLRLKAKALLLENHEGRLKNTEKYAEKMGDLLMQEIPKLRIIEDHVIRLESDVREMKR